MDCGVCYVTNPFSFYLQGLLKVLSYKIEKRGTEKRGLNPMIVYPTRGSTAVVHIYRYSEVVIGWLKMDF